MTESPAITALLFDLGGVLIDIDFDRALQRWSHSSQLPLVEITRRFSMDEPYRQHELGEIPASDYFAHLRQLLELEASDEEIAHGWNAIFVGEIAATIDCIATAREDLPCYLFSNTNPTHQAYWETAFPAALDSFQQIFVSSEMGLRKPDRAAFEAIAAATGFDLGEILFFDDTEENIIGAKQAGMPAILVNDHTDVENALTNIGVL
jgi:HAD superfamily hydrolase (TIGR01549 family)